MQRLKDGLRAQLPDAAWRKSSYSSPDGDNCVEVALLNGGAAVRDSNDPTGPALVFTTGEWDAFRRGAAAGEFTEL